MPQQDFASALTAGQPPRSVYCTAACPSAVFSKVGNSEGEGKNSAVQGWERKTTQHFSADQHLD